MSPTVPNVPYQVVSQVHDTVFRPDNTKGGQWTVTIKHGNDITSSFTVPEEAYGADAVHALAMQQVRAAQEVAGLPGTASRPTPPAS